MTERIKKQAYRLGINIQKENSIAKIIYAIRSTTDKSDKKFLTRAFVKDNCFGVTYEDTLDTYYINLINDTLRQIRHRQTAYIFSLYHIRDIFRFEPDANVEYNEDAECFVVTLKRPARKAVSV